MKKAKDDGIETLRGLAIILMVAGHVIGASSSSGLRVADDSLLRYLYYATQFLRMPLFTVISGFVYSLRPVKSDQFIPFVQGKVRRILLPFLTVSTLQYFCRAYSPNVNRPLSLDHIGRIYIYPFDHFWFLQSIFLVFLTVGLLDHFKLIQSFRPWLASFLAAIVATLTVPRFTAIFGFNGYLYLLPYFLLGCGLCRFPKAFRYRSVTSVAAAILFVGLILQQMAWFRSWSIDLHRTSVLALVIGIPAGVLLISYRSSSPWLARLGTYAYGIYLFHVFGTAGARILLTRLGVDSQLLLLMASLFSGLALPIVLERVVLSRTSVLQLCFLGVGPAASTTWRLPRTAYSTLRE